MQNNQISVETLRFLAKQAAESFLTSSRPLNESLSEQVLQHGLNQHQMRRVAEMANLSVHSTLYKSASEGGADRNVSFEIARPEQITKMLLEKTANTDTQPNTAEEYQQKPDRSWKSQYQTPATTGMQKSASSQGANDAHAASLRAMSIRAENRAKARLEKIAGTIRSNMAAARWERDAAFDQLTKTAARYIGSGVPFDTFHAALQSARPGVPEVPWLLHGVANHLHSTGVIDGQTLYKSAAMAADPALVSEVLQPTQKVNGNLTVLKTLDTLVNASREAEHQHDRLKKLVPNRSIGVRAVEL